MENKFLTRLPLAIRCKLSRFDLEELLEDFDFYQLPGKKDDSYLTSVKDIQTYGAKLSFSDELDDRIRAYCNHKRKSISTTIWQYLIFSGQWHPTDPILDFDPATAPRSPRMPDLSNIRLRVNHLGWFVIENPEIDAVLFLRTEPEKAQFLAACRVYRPEEVKVIPYKYAKMSLKNFSRNRQNV